MPIRKHVGSHVLIIALLAFPLCLEAQTGLRPDPVKTALDIALREGAVEAVSHVEMMAYDMTRNSESGELRAAQMATRLVSRLQEIDQYDLAAEVCGYALAMLREFQGKVSDARLHLYEGRLLEAIGEEDAAYVAYERAAALRRNDPSSLKGLNRLERKQGKRERYRLEKELEKRKKERGSKSGEVRN